MLGLSDRVPKEASSGTETVAEQERASDTERRHLTVFFCDLVESTALSEQLDPEDLVELIAAYHAASAEVIERFHGHVAQYQGDGVLAYFGYPHAQGDDAVHAVRAGLDIVRAVQGSQGPDSTAPRCALPPVSASTQASWS